MADSATNPKADPTNPVDVPTPSSQPDPVQTSGNPGQNDTFRSPTAKPGDDPEHQDDDAARAALDAARQVDHDVAARESQDPNERFRANPSVVNGVPVDNRPGRGITPPTTTAAGTPVRP